MNTALSEAIAVVKARVAALAKRPDVEILVKEIGRRAPAAVLRPYRAQPRQWPAEMLDFYGLMNGLRVEWRFVGADAGGNINIAPLGEYAFQTDDENYTSFGTDKVALRFDEIQPECGTFWVARADEEPARAHLVFANMKETGFVVADTLAQYLMRAAAASFADGWPTGGDESLDIVRRLTEPPVLPAKIRPGMRVHHSRKLCRGEVLETYALPPDRDIYYSHPSRQFALLRLDTGPTVWAGFDFIKALPKAPDMYEQLRADPWQLVRLGETEGWSPALRCMGLAWGGEIYNNSAQANDGEYYCYLWSSPVCLGVLNVLPLAEAAALVQRIAAGMEAGRIPVSRYDYFIQYTSEPEYDGSSAEMKLAFDRYEWNYGNWGSSAGNILGILISALALRIAAEPLAGRAALPLAAIDALQASTGVHIASSTDQYELMRKLLRGLEFTLRLDTQEADAALPVPVLILRD